MQAFQEIIPNNHCFGCGPGNEHGLQIKSYWEDTDQSICHYRTKPHHCAGPVQYVNGGILATLIDCHCICTAIMKGYELIGGVDKPECQAVWYVTGGMEIRYRRPVAIDAEITLRAYIIENKDKKMLLDCDLVCNDELCASARVTAIRAARSWLQ